MSQQEQLSQISEDDFDSWKHSRVGQLFFKELLQKLKQDNMVHGLYGVNMNEPDYVLARNVAARSAIATFMQQLQNLKHEEVITIMTEPDMMDETEELDDDEVEADSA